MEYIYIYVHLERLGLNCSVMELFHYTVPSLLDSTRLGSRNNLFHYKKVPIVLIVGGVVIARLCETAVTLFYMRHKHINNGGHGGDGVLAAVCVFLSHTKQREEKPNRCNAVVGI